MVRLALRPLAAALLFVFAALALLLGRAEARTERALVRYQWTNPGLSLIEGQQVRVLLRLPNAAATGRPAISGPPQVGRTLRAELATIADDDGLPATFPDEYTFQWVRVDGATETDIPDATSSTYTVVPADEGKRIKVRVSLTHNAGNAESLRSDPTRAAVRRRQNCSSRNARLSVKDAEAHEGDDASLDFVVKLSPAASDTVTVAYATSDGTATAGSDYETTNGELTLAPGETTRSGFDGVTGAILAAVGVAAVAAPLLATGEIRISMDGGRVTVIATEARLADVLAEWTRVGATRFVGSEAIGEETITLHLVDADEEEAIRLLLHAAAGLVAASRPAGGSGASRFDRVTILARRAASEPALVIPAPLEQEATIAVPCRWEAPERRSSPPWCRWKTCSDCWTPQPRMQVTRPPTRPRFLRS